MELEKLVLADLEDMDLKGVKILDLSCIGDDIKVNFEITDTQIEFIARDVDDFTTTSLTRNGNVYTEDKILSKCDGWVKYVGTMIMPIIKKHQEALEEIASIVDEEEDGIEAIIQEEESVESESPISNEIDKLEIIDEVERDSLEEAENKGHKEGYKAARKKNAQEIRKLKNKYHSILFFTIAILLAAFAFIWIQFGPGFNF